MLADKGDLALGFFRRPAIRLGAGAAHQHCPLGVAESVSLQEGLDGLLVVHDRKRARPVRPPQAALEPQASNKRVSGSQMSGNGYGSFDKVQAPVILITAFLRLASSTTFGRSAQGCGGAGGTLGCWMPIWSMMNRASGRRSISAVPASTLPQNGTLTGKSFLTAARRMRSSPGSSGARFDSFVRMMRMPTVPASSSSRQ